MCLIHMLLITQFGNTGGVQNMPRRGRDYGIRGTSYRNSKYSGWLGLSLCSLEEASPLHTIWQRPPAQHSRDKVLAVRQPITYYTPLGPSLDDLHNLTKFKCTHHIMILNSGPSSPNPWFTKWKIPFINAICPYLSPS